MGRCERQSDYASSGRDRNNCLVRTLQTKAKTKSGHLDFQIRPIASETGQHRLFGLSVWWVEPTSGFIGKLVVISRKIVHENDGLGVLHHEGERPHLRCSLAPMFFIPGI